MNSLRSRLILGFALVAVVPLTIAMLLLGQRIQGTVRAQAAARLDASLGLLQAQLAADGQRLDEKLALLAGDPQLKRLYLIETPTDLDLRSYLADQRFLLDLDFLGIADTSGRIIADGALAPIARASATREPLALSALAPAAGAGPQVARLAGVAALALDVSAPILYRGERVGVVRGGVALDSTVLARLKQTTGVDLVLRDAGGQLVASTLADGAALAVPPGDAAVRVTIGGRSWLARRVALAIGPAPHAEILGLSSTAAADEAVAALRTTSLLLGLLAVAVAIALGLVWSHQVSRPVERLARFSERISRGEWDEPLSLASVNELQTLVASLERMRTDLRAYRERLTASERQAAYGQMARKVAHEIKNPLTPIAISVADLKRSYDQQRPDFPAILEQAVRTIGEEVEALKRLLQEFSEFGRFPSPRLAPCDVAALLADLGTLYGHQVAAGRLAIERASGADTLLADRDQLRQVLVNLVQNGLDAAGDAGRVTVRARRDGAALELAVADTGAGLSAEQRAQLFVPGFTTKAHGSGLGLTIVERIVSEHRGTVHVESAPGRGTTFLIRLPIEREG